MPATRRSAASSASPDDDDAKDDAVSPPAKKKTRKVLRKRKVAVKRKKSTASDSEETSDPAQSDSESAKTKSTKATKKKRSPKKKKTPAEDDSGTEESAKATKPKRAKKTEQQRLTERDELPKLWDSKYALEKHGSYTFKVMSWNVAGLRALMKNHPTALPELASKYDFDVICLQETKLQEVHVDDPKLKISGHLLNDEGYDSYYSCATSKKGYAGTAVFVKRRKAVGARGSGKKQASLGSFFKSKKGKRAGKSTDDKEGADFAGEIDASNLVPVNVSYEIGKPEHDAEGRIITLDFPLFSLSNVYVPNSGQNLVRLQYRTERWDADLLAFARRKEKDRGVPVVWLGDLNVAHTGMEVWNEGAKHLAKSAGTTPEERASFARQLGAGYVDAFRELHPDARGQYTYWSQRAGNRTPNKGLRLDYFVCSEELMGGRGDEADRKVIVRDSYMIPDQLGSDHCPIVLELEIKK